MSKDTQFLLKAGALAAAGLLCAWASRGAIVPPERLGLWVPGAHVGVVGGIPTRTNIVTITGVDNTGATGVSAAIQAQVDTAPAGSVCYLPPGTYRLNTLIDARAGKTIRGAGTNTVLRAEGYAVRFYPDTVDWRSNYVVVSGFTRGSSNMTIGYQLGSDYIGGVGIFSQSNAPGVSHRDGYERVQKQKSTIVGVDGSNIVIWPPLLWTMTNTLGPEVEVQRRSAYITNAGLEDLFIDARESESPSGSVTMSRARDCWMKGVIVSNYYTFGVYAVDVLNCEFRQNTVLDPRIVNNSYPNHGGFAFWHSSFCLLEDNAGYNSFPIAEYNNCVSGMAVLYNYFVEVNGGAFAGGAVFGNHDAHAFANLYEGNKFQSFQSDGDAGSSSDTTLLRNWLTGTNHWNVSGDKFWRGVHVCKRQYRYNVVGNLVGSPGNPWTYITEGWPSYQTNYCYSFGYGGIGTYDFNTYDPEVLASAILSNNWDYATGGVPAAQQSAETVPDSYAYAAKPSWWDSSPWPPYGPAPTTNRIPSETRYLGLSSGGSTNEPPAPAGGDGGPLSGGGALVGEGGLIK